MKIQIINGPNVNLLGKREPTVYGNIPFEDYLDSFENWNQALVECYELGQKYTTSVLLKKWRKVLNFSE